MAVSKTKNGRWFVYYRKTEPDGHHKQVKEYFGRGVQGEVKAWRRNEELGLGRKKGRAKPSGPTFGELAKTYAQCRNFSENSLKHLLIRLKSNILPFFGNRLASGLTDQDLDDYVKKRRSDTVKKGRGENAKHYPVQYSTIARELTDVKAIMNFGANRKPPLIPFNPVRDYKKPKTDDAIIQPPTPAESAAILANASEHLVRAIKLAYYLGLRPGAVELFSLEWERSVNWDAGTIRVDSADKGGPRVRFVPIHKDLLPDLKAWAKADQNTGPLIHYHGKPIKKIETSWAGALKRSGIKRRIRPYDLRHYFVTAALEDGADLKALSEVVGSRPETIMRHYQHVTQQLHRDTVGKIPKLKEIKKAGKGGKKGKKS